MTEWELLRAAFDRYDPVPEDVRRAAESAGAFVRPCTVLPVLKGIRGEQVLRFDGVTVEVECADGVRLVGVADVVGGLWVRWPSGERAVVVDDLGQFVVDGLPSGPLSIVVRRAGSPDAVGPWFVA